jgi:hypothetical protein
METQLNGEPVAAVGLGVPPTLTRNGDRQVTFERQTQRELLEKLRDVFPAEITGGAVFAGIEHTVAVRELFYLSGHGLIDLKADRMLDGEYGFLTARITSAGIDFLADDGGLTAILGVVTVKFHEDTIKALLLQHVDRAPADETVKSSLRKQIKALPAEGLKHLTTKALDAGLSQMPNAAQWLQTLLSSAGT